MDHPWINTRDICPACGSASFTEVYSSPFDTDPIDAYLWSSHAIAGQAIDLDDLRGAAHTLCECDRCRVFQEQILIDALMDRVPEHSVDPEETLKGSRDSVDAVAPLEHINCFRRSSVGSLAEAAGMKGVFLKVTSQYRYLTAWSGARRSLLELLRPVYRSWLERGRNVFLRNKVCCWCGA